jgi:hypothetical protein
MSIPNKRFSEGNVYFIYKHENAMFFYDASTKKCFRKFVGETEETEVPHDNELLNDAILYGDEVDDDIYNRNTSKKDDEKIAKSWSNDVDLHGQYGWRGRIIKTDEGFVWESSLSHAQGRIFHETTACDSKSNSI